MDYTLGAALPSLLIWSIFAPAISLLFMIRYRYRNHERIFLTNFGFMFRGFRSHVYFWEYVVLARKALIIISIEFLRNVVQGISALTILIILMLAFYAHFYFKPYLTEYLNILETIALSALLLHLSCGLYYYMDDYEEFFEIGIFVLTATVKAFFFGLLLWCLISIICKKKDSSKERQKKSKKVVP